MERRVKDSGRGSSSRAEYDNGSVSEGGLSGVSASSYLEVSDSVYDGTRKVLPSRDVVFLVDHASVLLAVSFRMMCLHSWYRRPHLLLLLLLLTQSMSAIALVSMSHRCCRSHGPLYVLALAQGCLEVGVCVGKSPTAGQRFGMMLQPRTVYNQGSR